jgi:hypothetical protein
MGDSSERPQSCPSEDASATAFADVWPWFGSLRGRDREDPAEAGAPAPPPGQDDACCGSSCTTEAQAPAVEEGFAGTGYYPSEIAATCGYGLLMGSALCFGLVRDELLGPLDGLYEEELMATRSREVIKAAHRVRLEAIQSRRARPRTADDGAGAEMCCVCQVDFGEDDECLACRSCDSGFHAACLNRWLKRADTCPCCRKKISALKPLGCGADWGDSGAAAASRQRQT